MREIMLAVCKTGARVIRVNAGKGTVTIRKAQPFHGVPEGVSDLVGWSKGGRFLALEVKTRTGRATPAQLAFIEAVKGSGGIAGVVRSVDEALALVRSDTLTNSSSTHSPRNTFPSNSIP